MKIFLATFFSSVFLATLVQGQEWIPWSGAQGVPKVLPSGREFDYRPLYLVRYNDGREVTPGKYLAEHGTAYFALNGKELATTNFELFTATNVKWIPMSNGVIPPKAVVGGYVNNKDTLYIGRVHYRGSITPGKILPGHGCTYFSYEGKELKSNTYEQLVYV